MAARMEQLATPGSIRLTASTSGSWTGWCGSRPWGPSPSRAWLGFMAVFELTEVTTLRRRLQAAAVRGDACGATARTDAPAALAQAQAGHGQVVALMGEAGVGKSRLAQALRHTHPTPGWLMLESASMSYGKATLIFRFSISYGATATWRTTMRPARCGPR